jgi:methylated-DNA-[protein]-cysteine S-methyltransferase
MMKKIYIYKYNSEVGNIRVTSDGENVTGLLINKIGYDDAEIISVTAENLDIFNETKRWLDCYFSGIEPNFMPNIKVKGSEFSKSVWKILCEIPYGKVITYGDIAKRIMFDTGKRKMSAQAIGGAVKRNPVSILIPCHRVVGAGGNLTGYGGGLDVKVKLLQLEGIDVSKFYMPSK